MLELFSDIDLGVLPRYGAALTLGLLIGLERERKPSAKAGLRTFALTALFGVLAGQLAALSSLPWFIAVGLAGVAAMIVSAYLRDYPQGGDPGTTTEAALFLAYGLGVLAWYEEYQLAATLAIGVTMLLYFKAELRGISQKLTHQDLISMLQFAVVSLIVLPLLPNRDFGPHGALNPYQIWWMVVLISGLSLASYATLRVIGQRYGAVVLGALGGLVSSTATTLAFSRHARENPAMEPVSIVVIILANMVVMLRLGVLVAVVGPSALYAVLPMLVGGFLAGTGVALYWMRKLHPAGEMPELTLSNPAEIRTAVMFGALYSLVLLAAAWLTHRLGAHALYAVSLVSGLTDVDAITLSSLRLFGLNQIDADTLTIVVMLAVLANLAFKSAVVVVINGRRIAWQTGAGMGAVGAGMVLAWLGSAASL